MKNAPANTYGGTLSSSLMRELYPKLDDTSQNTACSKER